jgi:hypothetical protein
MTKCTLYVDIENLMENARKYVLSAIKNWPVDFPEPETLKLYVRADQAELWEIWANHHIPGVEALIQGVQHYCFNGSKNSADISLALDALSDLLNGKTAYIALLSDDSDFVSLFTVIKREFSKQAPGKIPFKWLMTDRTDTRSQILGDFFPKEYVHVVGVLPVLELPEQEINKAPPVLQQSLSEEEQIARAILKDMPMGVFKSSDCKKIILKYFPDNPMAKEDSAKFGTHFSKVIWPILEKNGVLLPKPNRKPRKYEMTEDAKKRPGS